MPKSIVIIDNSNFYFKLKSLNLAHTQGFDYFNFIKFFTKGTKLTATYVCMAKIRADKDNSKAQMLMSKQQQLINRLARQKMLIQLGYLLPTSDGHFHEKGVDIQIAVNILKGAYKNLYDRCFLVSSDSDLVPAISEAQELGKTVVYVGFHHQPSFALLRTAKESKLLTKDSFLPFLSSQR